MHLQLHSVLVQLVLVVVETAHIRIGKYWGLPVLVLPPRLLILVGLRSRRVARVRLSLHERTEQVLNLADLGSVNILALVDDLLRQPRYLCCLQVARHSDDLLPRHAFRLHWRPAVVYVMDLRSVVHDKRKLVGICIDVTKSHLLLCLSHGGRVAAAPRQGCGRVPGGAGSALPGAAHNDDRELSDDGSAQAQRGAWPAGAFKPTAPPGA
mmetsp:Transcript_85620/g.190362  ORF Transcript_85620/g.190362 Transcript_85620/m.190362 type:complete len:210 (-) Transcript_85620:1-630(-)